MLIRTSCLTCANRDACAFVTPKRPNANSRHTAPRVTPEHERHLIASFKRPYFSNYIFPSHQAVFGRRVMSYKLFSGNTRRTSNVTTVLVLTSFFGAMELILPRGNGDQEVVGPVKLCVKEGVTEEIK